MNISDQQVMSNTKKRYTANNRTILKDLVKNKILYLMVLPIITYFIIFHYLPMFGVVMAFQDYKPTLGFLGSKFVGFKHYISYFCSYSALRTITNTFILNIYDLIFAFPSPIIFALLLNELKNKLFKRTVQTITYIPHFISMVVVVSMLLDFFQRDGVVNQLLSLFIKEPIPFFIRPEWFRPLYIGSGIWQSFGWISIIYLAALTNIDQSLYEAAEIDGAGRWRKVINITIPGITPTIVMMFILQMGTMLNIGPQKILLMYNPAIYSTADVISTFVYRRGLIFGDYSFSAAIGLFNSVVSFLMVVLSNKISRHVTETSLW